MSRRRYRKKPDQYVVAVRLDLDTDGFSYTKWGDTQRCKRGDWLVENDGDVYSVDADTFARTYQRLEPGRYLKTTPVWAHKTTEAGSVATKEGRSHYEAGDYLVSNEEDGGDSYCVGAQRFERTYELDE